MVDFLKFAKSNYNFSGMKKLILNQNTQTTSTWRTPVQLRSNVKIPNKDNPVPSLDIKLSTSEIAAAKLELKYR
jgi:hypothetical protein